MSLIICIPVMAVLLLMVYVLCLKPNTRRKYQMKPFEEVYIAHRGFFDNEGKAPENSMMAFRKAAGHGFGIELDVRLTADNYMVVFHDENLKRMCGITKKVRNCTYNELRKYTLKDTLETIPLLREVLNEIAGKVPLVIEIKAKGNYGDTVKKLAEIMKDYRGIYCIESFNPLAVAWYRKKHPEVLRGQLSSGYLIDGNGSILSILRETVFSNLLLNWYSKPDFIAYNHEHASQFPFYVCRKLYGVENVAWTIRNQEELNKAKEIFQVFIFDSFIPDE